MELWSAGILDKLQKLSEIRKPSSRKDDGDDLSRPLVSIVQEHLDAVVTAIRKFDDNMAFAQSERWGHSRPCPVRHALVDLKVSSVFGTICGSGLVSMICSASVCLPALL